MTVNTVHLKATKRYGANYPKRYQAISAKNFAVFPGGGGGTPLFGLYGDVPLDRVWFFGLAVLNRVYNLTCLCLNGFKTCPKQGMVLRADRL